MSKKETFKYIEITDEEPTFPKAASFRSLSAKIIDEFLVSKKDHVLVHVPEGKKIDGMTRGIAKVLKNRKLKFTARIDDQRRLWIIPLQRPKDEPEEVSSEEE